MRSTLDKETGAGRKVRDEYMIWTGSSELTHVAGPSTVNYPPPEGKKPDAVYTHQTTAESALLYRYVVLHRCSSHGCS